MKEMTINQLLCLAKAEILAIRDMLIGQVAALAPNSADHRDALATLANIEAVLARPEFAAANFGSTGPGP